ncbi:MAG: hypothetical protein HUU21_08290 [Polyangiaceae bacterium]|nr:hypothetical protein [Polyangiaceae bacterium]
MAGMMGCLNRPIEPLEPRRTSTIVERLTQSSVDKIDLVLGIDNSRSMADKQQILELAIPDLVKGLVNPRCLDQNGVPAAMQPTGPVDPCPIAGTKREFEPVVDIHIGIISSSIGGHGADSCPDQENNTCAPNPNFTNNDKGHLVARSDECGGGDVPTYENKSFLAWDPKQKLTPPGEGNLDNLVVSLRNMVIGTGQIGCGYEAQLESWYRFLIDPEPYEKITAIDGKATPEGLDQTLLAQRADFLRPDSLLAIIMLTDENDCSIKEFGQFFFAAQLKNANGTPFHLPRARAECAANPNDPCCLSCGQNPGSCPMDPTCFDANNNVKALTDAEDASNLRCFDQKRRFGIDFLYPIDRYTTGLTSVTVPNRAGELVPNPIFSDLNPLDSNSTVRDAGLVFLAGIVGVPWQDIARNKDDLTLGFKSAAELEDLDSNGLSTWDIILGDPATLTPPADPHMIETVFPRSGVNPITGDAIKQPGDPTNPINGSEWTVKNVDDLQYACIFDLPTPRDCSDASIVSCDCKDPTNDNPLCQPDPVDPTKRTLQTKAKGYPGVRELQVLKSIGSQGITASVCPKQLSAQDQPDFGYRPAIGAIIDRLKIALKGQCLPRTLTPDAAGQVPCLLLEARRVEESLVGQCNACKELGRQPVSTEHQAAVQAAKQDPIAEASDWNCFCEITQVTGDNLVACQDKLENPPLNSAGEEVNGWCYVDATTTPYTGNPDIVADCPETEKRIIRFVGEGGAKAGATIFITCSGE